jgi:hypothetical protein
MKRMLISAACVIFILGTAFARESTATPTFVLHGASIIAARRAAQLYADPVTGGVGCATRFVTTTRANGSSTTRQSVDCQE